MCAKSGTLPDSPARLVNSLKADTGNCLLRVCASVHRSLLADRIKTGKQVAEPVYPRRTEVQAFEKT